MSMQDIHIALRVQLTTLSVAKSYENVKYEPTVGTAYVRERFLPDASVQESLGSAGYNRITGVYLIDAFCPAGEGVDDAEDLADTVLAAFARGSVLTSSGVSVVIEKSYRSAGRSESDWYQVPIVVQFRADIAP